MSSATFTIYSNSPSANMEAREQPSTTAAATCFTCITAESTHRLSPPTVITPVAPHCNKLICEDVPIKSTSMQGPSSSSTTRSAPSRNHEESVASMRVQSPIKKGSTSTARRKSLHRCDAVCKAYRLLEEVSPAFDDEKSLAEHLESVKIQKAAGTTNRMERILHSDCSSDSLRKCCSRGSGRHGTIGDE